MTITNRYPPKLYLFLLDIANRNGPLAIKEVETIFLRRQAEALGFECVHERMGFSKKTNEPFCRDCWTRMSTIERPIFRGKKIVKEGEYLPVETFLDRIYKEQSKKETPNKVTMPQNLF
jgi:hypothetical protein